MRANHISTSERLKQRIQKLKNKYEGMWLENPPSPYPLCASCDMTNVEVSIRDGHRSWCEYSGLEKEIEQYEKLLKEALQKESA